MEGAKIEGPITIRVPYTKRQPLHDLLKRFSDELEGGVSNNELVYTVWGLRLTELIQTLELVEGKLELQPYYPNYPDVS